MCAGHIHRRDRMAVAATRVRCGRMGESPLSGDVTQAFNPVNWWGQQAGFININTSRTSNPAMERRIVEQVASYGRQLGRIVDALDVLVARTSTADQTACERDALRAFSQLAAALRAVKGDPPGLTLSRLDALLGEVSDLARTDPALHRAAVRRINASLAADAARTAIGPASSP
jgi:hypothetical protein